MSLHTSESLFVLATMYLSQPFAYFLLVPALDTEGIIDSIVDGEFGLGGASESLVGAVGIAAANGLPIAGRILGYHGRLTRAYTERGKLRLGGKDCHAYVFANVPSCFDIGLSQDFPPTLHLIVTGHRGSVVGRIKDGTGEVSLLL